jgi:hypothetical protein
LFLAGLYPGLCHFLVGLHHGYHLFQDGYRTIKWLHDYPSHESQSNDSHFNTVQ